MRATGVPASAPILGYRVDASYFQKWESIPKPLRYKAVALVAASCVPASDEVAALRETVATLTQVILERNAEINRLVGRERYGTSGVPVDAECHSCEPTRFCTRKECNTSDVEGPEHG